MWYVHNHILVKVFDATGFYTIAPTHNSPTLHMAMQENCPMWLSEVPVNSFVAVTFSANPYNTDNLSLNLLVVNILALPCEYVRKPSDIKK